ncbi:MAG: hypothetical protein ACOZJX_21865 [Pseudomonadota bacterium]
MQIGCVGQWEFGIPSGWSRTENESSDSYFENEEADKGLYVKLVRLSEPKASPRDLAKYIQGVHLRAFTEKDGESWAVVGEYGENDLSLFRSVLDLYNNEASYRVLSLVVCTEREALQVTVHDYWCQDHEASRENFIEIERSIVMLPAA